MPRRWKLLLRSCVPALLCSSCLFHFDRSLAPGELRGTAVIRNASGALVPAPNAVAALGGSTLTITADSQGVFAFEGLPAGSYTIDVSASSSGSGPANLGLHLTGIAIGAGDGADLGQIVLGALGGLQGTVLLEGAPVEAATAVIPGVTQTPVKNGSYQLGVLLPGKYQLSVFLADNPGAIESSLINVLVNPGQTTQVPPITLSTSELQTTGAATGVAMLSGATSSASIDIQFSGAGPDLSTNNQGQYSGTGIPAGIYSITASLGGFQSVTVSDVVIGGATTVVPTITMFPGNNPSPDAGSDAGTDAGSPAGPPGAPTNVSASFSDGVVTVSWTAPADDGGSAIIGYAVTSSPGNITATTTGATSVQVTGLTNGQSYTFTVQAENIFGESPASAPSPAVTPLGPPTAPLNVMAAPGDGFVTVSWTAPLSNGGSAITDYVVTASPGGATTKSEGLSVQFTGLADGQSYTFTVQASNALGLSPASAPSASVTAVGPPTAPLDVQAVAGDSVATVSWSAPTSDGDSPITGYTVTVVETGATSSTTQGTSLEVTGLTNGESYTFTVHATNAVGDGPESAPSEPVIPVGPPTAPLNVLVADGDTMVTVSWSAPLSDGGSAITGYVVTASPGGASASTTGALSAQITGLTDGQSYTFTVVATNAIGTGPASAPSNPVTPAPPPPVPGSNPDGGTITYTRIPWGSVATGGTPSFSVAGQAASASGDYGVLVFDGADPATANQLGSATVDGTGAFTAALTNLDHPVVYVAGVSDAGIVSTAAPVENVNWTATFGGKTPGVTTTNPHVLTTTGDFILDAYRDCLTCSKPKRKQITGPNYEYFFSGPLVPDGLFAREASSYTGVTAPGDGQTLTEDAIGAAWRNITPGPPDRWGSVASYDSVAKQLIVFGGCAAGEGCTTPLTDTWFWDGLNWTNETSGLNGSPTGRVNAVMAYDSFRQQTVLFGGETWADGTWTALNDTWTFQTDGFGWNNVTPSSGNPTASDGAVMVFDSVRNVTVLQTNDGNTWTWNGNAWTEVTPAGGNNPPARSYAGMAFDSIRGVAVLFGGCGSPASGLSSCSQSGPLLNDTWEWNGSSWAQPVIVEELPPNRAGFGMTYDSARGVTILTGGFEGGGYGTTDTWEWNGSTWTESLDESNEAPRFLTNLVYDSVRSASILLSGCIAFEGDGNPCASTVGDIWMWDGTNFNPLNLDGTDPGVPAGSPGLVFDSGRYVDVFYGPVTGTNTSSSQVDELNGTDWSPISPTTSSPPPRFDSAMVYDSVAAQTTLFGGFQEDGSTNLADTWIWNGQAWQNETPITGQNPAARHNHAMAFDSNRGVSVLFGGHEDGVVNDTWEWTGPQQVEAGDGGIVEGNGSWFNPEFDGGVPEPRDQHMMTFDQAQETTVLFGGSSDGTNANLTDTWQYAGSGWNEMSPATSPPAREDGAFVYDATRGLDLLFGGITNNSASSGYNDLWEWDGTNWTSIAATGVTPGLGAWSGATYDQNLDGMLLAGGQFGSTSYNQTWLLPSDVNRIPLEVAQFSFAAAGAVLPVISQMTFNVYAGGSGNSVSMPGRGTAVPGAQVGIWSSSNAAWMAVASNTSGPASTAQILYTTGSPAEAQDYLYNATQTINVAVAPTVGRGNGLTPTEINVDYVEVTVNYQLGTVPSSH